MTTTPVSAQPSDPQPKPHRPATAPAPLKRERPRTRAKDVRHASVWATRLHEATQGVAERRRPHRGER